MQSNSYTIIIYMRIIKYTPMTYWSSSKFWLCDKAKIHFVTKPIINFKNIFFDQKNKKIKNKKNKKIKNKK